MGGVAESQPIRGRVRGRPVPRQSTVGQGVCDLRTSDLPWGLAPCCTACLPPHRARPPQAGALRTWRRENGHRQAQSAEG